MRRGNLSQSACVALAILLNGCVSSGEFKAQNAKIEKRLSALGEDHRSGLRNLRRYLRSETSQLEQELQDLKRSLAQLQITLTEFEGDQRETEKRMASRAAKAEARIDEMSERLGEIRLSLLRLNRQLTHGSSGQAPPTR